MRKVPLHDPDRCAEIFREHGFNRSPTAIVVRSKRLDIARRYRATFSATSAAKLLGVDATNFCMKCLSGEVRAVKRKTNRLPQQGGDPWSVTREDLRSYVLNNLERIDIRKVDKFAFVDLLINSTPPMG